VSPKTWFARLCSSICFTVTHKHSLWQNSEGVKHKKECNFCMGGKTPLFASSKKQVPSCLTNTKVPWCLFSTFTDRQRPHDLLPCPFVSKLYTSGKKTTFLPIYSTNHHKHHLEQHEKATVLFLETRHLKAKLYFLKPLGRLCLSFFPILCLPFRVLFFSLLKTNKQTNRLGCLG